MTGSFGMKWRRWAVPMGVGLACALVPLTASAVRRRPAPECAADGVVLADPPAARITSASGKILGFCCIGCARRWLAATRSRPASIEVRDETTGRPIDAALAHYAWSPVLTQPATGDRLHAFARPEDAQRHAKFFNGSVLTERSDPFDGVRPGEEGSP